MATHDDGSQRFYDDIRDANELLAMMGVLKRGLKEELMKCRVIVTAPSNKPQLALTINFCYLFVFTKLVVVLKNIP